MKVYKNTDGLISRKEIAEQYNIKPSSVSYYANEKYHWEKCKVEGMGKKAYYKIDQVLSSLVTEDFGQGSQFGNIDLYWDEVMKPIDPIIHFNGFARYQGQEQFSRMVYACKTNKYMVTNYGRVVNITRFKIFTSETKCSHDYIQVTLGDIIFMVHRLVAYFFCNNGKNKDFVHHINGIRTDNRAINLVWCTHDEHIEAHRLFERASETNDDADWCKYYQYIDELKKDNEITEIQKVIHEVNASGHRFYIILPETKYNECLGENGMPDTSKLDINDITFQLDDYQIKQIRSEVDRVKQMREI